MGTICISGAQGTGKSTLARQINAILGLAPSSPQMREIVNTTFSGTGLAQLSPTQTFSSFMLRALGRLTEQLPHCNGVYDGSLLNDVAYLKGRIRVGAFGKNSRITDTDFIALVERFENLTFQLMERLNIEAIVHLPIEFGPQDDGHRPLYDEFRLYVDEYLLSAYPKLSFPMHQISGSPDERLNQLLNLIGKKH